MESTNPSDILSSDRAGKNPNEDQLGYAPFAQHLAQSIMRMTPPDGIVIALYGPWGSGKTTLLQYTTYHLQQLPLSQQPLILYFNPWWFSGSEDLVRRFFNQVRAALKDKSQTNETLLTQLADFTDAISEAPLPYVKVGKTVSKIIRPEVKDVAKIKDVVAQLLLERTQKILIIVDDIDRLPKEEIRQLFRMIKAVGDFPNVIYLLAFDKDVVIEALKEGYPISGEEYLEKIVQVPLELPLPEREGLETLLFERLNSVLATTPDSAFDQSYWTNVYVDGIAHFLHTPRDVIRLTNALTLTYAAVQGEVNPVDFIGIETLRLFCPSVYDVIRRNPQVFTRDMGLLTFYGEADPSKRLVHDMLAAVQEADREPVKKLLLRLFPRLGAVWGNQHFSGAWEGKWRKELRVCSSDIFPAYFRLALPKAGLSQAEVRALLASLADREHFGTLLQQYAQQIRANGMSQLRTVLDRLQDYIERDIPDTHVLTILFALLDIGDDLQRAEPGPLGMLDFTLDRRMEALLVHVLKRLQPPLRFTLLRQAITEGHAVSLATQLVTYVGLQHGKYGDKPDEQREQFVSSDELNKLEHLCADKMRLASQNDEFIHMPNLPAILYRWQNWSDPDEAKTWVEHVTEDEHLLPILLERFARPVFSQTVGDVATQRRLALESAWLEPFIAPSRIVDKLTRLQKEKLTQSQRAAIRALMEDDAARSRASGEEQNQTQQ